MTSLVILLYRLRLPGVPMALWLHNLIRTGQAAAAVRGNRRAQSPFNYISGKHFSRHGFHFPAGIFGTGRGAPREDLATGNRGGPTPWRKKTAPEVHILCTNTPRRRGGPPRDSKETPMGFSASDRPRVPLGASRGRLNRAMAPRRPKGETSSQQTGASTNAPRAAGPTENGGTRRPVFG